MLLFCFLILFFNFSLAYRGYQVYSVQVYIFDITSNNYTTVIREIIKQLKAFSTIKTNFSVILVLMKLKISLNTFMLILVLMYILYTLENFKSFKGFIKKNGINKYKGFNILRKLINSGGKK
jgi:hypothetical protein